MKNKSMILGWIVLAALFFSGACASIIAPGANVGATSTAQVLALGQTQTALQATSLALAGLITQQASATVTSTLQATPLPVSTTTSTPGPVVIDDDFSQDVGRWQGCAQCLISDGVMYMGPYPAVDSGKGYTAICKDCGVAETYKMAVDVTYVSGASDRGFGLMLWENDGYYINFEISTWKSYSAWFYDKDQDDSWDAWSAILPVTTSSAIRPGRLSNRLAVVVSTQDGKKVAAVSINGRAIQPTELKGGSGQVGLVVGLHSIGVAFDNFHFEAAP